MSHPLVFISYSHKDERYKNDLLGHLEGLQDQVGFELWTDDKIGGGKSWKQEIEQAIKRAKVAILLVTPNFLSSEFVQRVEIPNLLERREREGLVLFPIIARSCAWKKVRWLAEIQGRPKNGRPIWTNKRSQIDKDLTAIAEEIADILSVATLLPQEQVHTWQRHRYKLEQKPEYKTVLEVIDLLQGLNIILDQELVEILVKDWMRISRNKARQILEQLKNEIPIEKGDEPVLLDKQYTLQNNELGQHLLNALDDFRHLIIPHLLFEGLFQMSKSEVIQIEIAIKLWDFLPEISTELSEDVAFNCGAARSRQGDRLSLEAIENFFTALQKYPHLASRIRESLPVQYISYSDLEEPHQDIGEVVETYIYLCQEGLKHLPNISTEAEDLLIALAEKAVELAPDKIETQKNRAIVLDEVNRDTLPTLDVLDKVVNDTQNQDADILYRSARRRYLNCERLADVNLEEERNRLEIELSEAYRNLNLLVGRSDTIENIEEAQEQVQTLENSLRGLNRENFLLSELQKALRDVQRAHELSATEKTSELINEIFSKISIIKGY